ncbi:acetate and butyrate kinase [Saccharata proteae CBS 121410]|uniref:Probable acetate kinase n=1 Tax=Saccharata proteae CBS 121410 TaxID=1314787 RepID=A0A9P4LWN9_9PEZI|nr:acetate and butyrate kinase [Saccharata proteae CBS 121410]
MPRIILSINAGSSSVKLSVYTFTTASSTPHQLAEASIEGLTAPPAKLKYTRGDHRIKGQEITEKKITSQEDAFNYLVEKLLEDEGLPELKEKGDVEFACHRVVHGGDYGKAKVVDRRTYERIERLSDLAPLHNSSSLSIIRATHTTLPHTTNIAFFDTSFHATLPRHTYTYPIDPSLATHNKLRKYGFHGLSYSFITRRVSTHLGTPSPSLNIIALHLGSGASVCCIKDGRSWDTSMGLTPLDGLPGATRSGSVDPSLVFHYTHDAGMLSRSSTKEMHITQAEEILNKKSGWKALTGTTDFGHISAEAEKCERGESGDEMCRLAFDIFVDRVVGFVAGYWVKLGGRVDALVFAGGIGEKGVYLRERVGKALGCLGVVVDGGKNGDAGKGDEVVVDVGGEGAKCRVLVVKTDEQAEMAGGCVEGLGEWEKEREKGKA